MTIFVANRPIPGGSSSVTEQRVIDSATSTVDDHIMANATSGDLVITRDIPLSAALVDRGIKTINDRGTEYSTENVKSRLSERNLMAELRLLGAAPPMAGRGFGPGQLKEFAATFDRVLTAMLRD